MTKKAISIVSSMVLLAPLALANKCLARPQSLKAGIEQADGPEKGGRQHSSPAPPQISREGPADSPLTPISVTAGLLENERTDLLKQINDAKQRGIGIEPYMAMFRDIEKMAQQGVPGEKIEASLAALKAAINEQLSSVGKGMIRGFHYNVSPLDNSSPAKKSPGALLPTEKARLYMLGLINKDRAKYHLLPLTLDPVATVAGQRHSDEMAAVGYLAHYDTLGKKPDQRYTEAGGIDRVGENIAEVIRVWTTSGGSSTGSANIKLQHNPHFSIADLERLQTSFMTEKPPHDGHRLQILRPDHNKVGIGLSYSVADQGDSIVALTQEFVDRYGEYSKLPDKITRGCSFKVSGTLFRGVKTYSVCSYWDPAPKPMDKTELDKMPRMYSMPFEPEANLCVTDQPGSLKTWVQSGYQHFSASITPTKIWKSGLYYIVIWATRPGTKVPTIISSRTVCLE